MQKLCHWAIFSGLFTIKKQFIDDLENQKMHDHIAKLNRALLVMHSPKDSTVKIDNAKKIYEQANHPKSFVSLAYEQPSRCDLCSKNAYRLGKPVCVRC